MNRIQPRALLSLAGKCRGIAATVVRDRAVCPPAELRAAATAVVGLRPARSLLRHRRISRLVSATAGVVVAAGLAIPAASADVGGLVCAGCIGNLAGCTPTTPANALDGPQAVTVVGNQIYAASSWEGTVSHVTMSAAGNLTYDGDLPVSEATALAAVNGQL